MKITITVPRSPYVDPQLLVRFIKKKSSEKGNQLAITWVALALAAVSDDKKLYDRLKKIISCSSTAEKIVSICRDVFVPALQRCQDVQFPDFPDCSREKVEYPSPDDGNFRLVLRHAVREGQRMLATKDYEFLNVFEILAVAGLEPYSFRLSQFKDERETFQDDPENLLRRRIEIIRGALVSPRKEK